MISLENIAIVTIIIINLYIIISAYYLFKIKRLEIKKLKSEIEIDQKKFKLYEFTIFRKYGASNNDLNVIDRIITDSVDKYKILHFGFDKDFYMTDKIRDKMIKDILEEVLKSLSPEMFNTLSVIYNKESLEDIILSKIKLAILDFEVSTNGTYKE